MCACSAVCAQHTTHAALHAWTGMRHSAHTCLHARVDVCMQRCMRTPHDACSPVCMDRDAHTRLYACTTAHVRLYAQYVVRIQAYMRVWMCTCSAVCAQHTTHVALHAWTGMRIHDCMRTPNARRCASRGGCLRLSFVNACGSYLDDIADSSAESPNRPKSPSCGHDAAARSNIYPVCGPAPHNRSHEGEELQQIC